MSCLYCLPDVLPVSFTDLTQNLSRGRQHWTNIGSIWTLLSSTDVHLDRSIDTKNNDNNNGTQIIFSFL